MPDAVKCQSVELQENPTNSFLKNSETFFKTGKRF
jgi:hypothetical protein